MRQNNIIEINGKRFDAYSGQPLEASNLYAPSVKPQPRPARTIDGVLRSNKASAQPIKVHTKVINARPTEKSVQAHRPERAQTLIRRAVQKPAMNLKPAIKTQVASEIAAAPLKDIAKPLAKKLSVESVDANRLSRARQIARSQNIQRYALAPNREKVYLQPSKVSRPNASPAKAEPQNTSIVPSPQTSSQTKPQDIFEIALAHATSHQQTYTRPAKRRNKKLLNSLAAGLAVLILGSFFAYLNFTSIQLMAASHRANFSAKLPSYKPNGYALKGGIQAEQNKISAHFASGDSSFNLVEHPSDWDSQTLLDNFLAINKKPTNTVQSRGRTIYFWNNTATWVNGGVQYEIDTNASLNNNDIVAIATSI